MDEGETLINGFVKHKFGLVGLKPGSYLQLRVDTSMGGSASERGKVRGRGEKRCVGEGKEGREGGASGVHPLPSPLSSSHPFLPSSSHRLRSCSATCAATSAWALQPSSAWAAASAPPPASMPAWSR